MNILSQLFYVARLLVCIMFFEDPVIARYYMAVYLILVNTELI